MDILKNILSQEIIQRLGWTLVHFVWQAAAIGLLLAIVLRLLHKSLANLRYIIACMALTLIVLMPIVTIRMLDVPVETIEPVKLAPVDLPKAEFNAPPIVQTPQLQSSPTQAAVTPPVSLKDKFIAAVEPALPYVVLGWLVGVFGLSIWHLGGWAQLQRLRRKMVKQVSERVNLRLKHLTEQLGIKRAVEIAESALVQVPAVVGWLRPVILLPASALTGLSGEQLEAILAHELAHIKRCDYLVNMLQTAVEILGFYHPAVWWVSHKIRAERENCCDDLAVAVSGDRVGYARALTSLEEVRAGYTLAVAASGGSLFERIRRLLIRDHPNEAKPSWLPSAIAIMLIASLLIPVCFAMSGSLKPESETIAKKEQKELSEFKAALPNGVTVELVGLGTAPWKTEQQWWKPDGTNLNQPGLKFPYLFQWKDQPNGWRFTCTALCKFSNYTGKEISVPEVKFSNEEMLTRVWGTDFTTDGYEMTYIACIPFIGTVPDKTDMRLAVGSKKFVQAKRIGKKYTPKQHQIHYLEKNSDQIILHPVRIGQVGTPCVDLTCKQENKEIEFRVFAKLKNGETEPWHGGGIGKDVLFFQSTPKRQNTKIEDIEDIIIEFRPYEWVEFKNVSLKPNFKTDVQIEVQNTVLEVGKENPQQKNQIKEVYLPDEDYSPVILDLAIGDLIEVPDVNSDELSSFLRKGKGDLGYASDDEGSSKGFVLLRDATINRPIVRLESQNLNVYSFSQNLPEDLIVTTKEDNTYHVTVLSADKEGCRLKFWLTQKPAVQVSPNESAARLRVEELRKSSESLKKLRSLGLMLIMYADDHDERYPSTLELIKRYDDKDEVVSWALENVGYLGRGRSVAVEPQALIAYDKTMLLENGCTNLLFNDSHVEFCEKKRVKDTNFGGISLLDFENRWNSAQKLSDLGKCMLIFASDHNERYPQSLDELSKADWFGKAELDWLKENIQYLGYKEKPTSRPATVLAYDKTLLEKGESTNVLYNDCRVKFEKPEKLKKLGIKTDNSTGRIKKFKRQLEEPVVVHIDKSPDGSRLTIQYAVMAICKAAGVPYNWDKSAKYADPQRRNYIEPVNVENIPANKALEGILTPAGLGYDLGSDGLFLYRLGEYIPQILTSARILLVPADLPQLKEIISDDKSKTRMITPDKLEEFLNFVRNTPQVRMISAPKLLTNDGEVGELRTENAKDFESIKLNIKNTVGADRKTITLELVFECTRDKAEEQAITRVSAKATVLSEHAIAVTVNIAEKDQILLLIVKPQILENQSSKTGVVQTQNPPGQIKKFKQQLEEPVTVHIDKSPDGSRLTIQYAVIAVCKASGVPYNWDKSAELADPQRREYIEPVNIENNVASQAIADMVGPVGLLYGVDAKGVYLCKPEKAAATQSNLKILNIELEPVAQGKNIIYAAVENASSKEQLFAVHIYTRSVDYGPHGVGWGTRFFEKINPNETRRSRFAYKIQGPVTENTYIRVKFYNPATEEQYNYDKPFAVHLYKGSDLKRRSEKKKTSISTKDFTEIIIGNFIKVQSFIKDKKYEQAWDLFSEDYQKSEYQVRGFERFEKAMEPKHPLDSAFTWEKSQFLKLKPKQLDIDLVTLLATYKKEIWKISFTEEDNQWKIDDIVGYRPRILDIQEEDNK